MCVLQYFTEYKCYTDYEILFCILVTMYIYILFSLVLARMADRNVFAVKSYMK